jgi:hypothetical protein
VSIADPVMYLDGLATLDFATGTYTVTRGASPTFVDGVAVSGSTSTFTLNASVQPLDEIQIRRLPEGQRTDDYRAVYTDTQLNTTESTQIPDTLVIDGDVFQVTTSERYQELGNYFCSVVQRVGRLGTNS